jgi:hypothetical protein
MRNCVPVDPHGADADREARNCRRRRRRRADRLPTRRGTHVRAPRARGLTLAGRPRYPLLQLRPCHRHPAAVPAPIRFRAPRRRYRVADDSVPSSRSVTTVMSSMWAIDVEYNQTAAVQSGVVEEVVVLPLAPGAVRHDFHRSRRYRLPRELIVDDDTSGGMARRRTRTPSRRLRMACTRPRARPRAPPRPHATARCVAASKRSTMRWPAQPRGTKTCR